MRYLIVLTLVTGVLIAGATMATADPNVPDITAHRHFLATPGGKLVQVGPRLCDDPSLQQAFNQFHINIHASATSPTTPIDMNGAELVIRGC